MHCELRNTFIVKKMYIYALGSKIYNDIIIYSFRVCTWTNYALARNMCNEQSWGLFRYCWNCTGNWSLQKYPELKMEWTFLSIFVSKMNRCNTIDVISVESYVFYLN